MKTIIYLAVAVLLLVLFAQAASPKNASEALKPYQAQLANDFEKQYAAVVQSGSMVDRCVRAGLVAEGYLQAGDQVKYSQWKSTEKADCQAAGVPR